MAGSRMIVRRQARSVRPTAREATRRNRRSAVAGAPVAPTAAGRMQVSRLPGVTVVRLAGEIDAWVVETVCRPALAEAGRVGGALVVELPEVTFMDVAGLNLLVELRSRAKAAGLAFWLTDPPDRVRRLARLAGLDALLLPQEASDCAGGS